MTVLDEMRAAVARDPALLAALREASAGDLSILHALLDTEGSRGTTVTGSANARLWPMLAGIGLMRRVDAPNVAEVAPGVEVVCFELTDRAYRALPVLLAMRAEGGSGG